LFLYNNWFFFYFIKSSKLNIFYYRNYLL
jgi:hypothetical protein